MTKNVPISWTSAASALCELAVIALGALTTACVPNGAVVADHPHAADPPSASGAGPAVQQATVAAAPSPPLLPPPPGLAFDDAIDNAAHAVLSAAASPDSGAAPIVIDPLVDGMTGYQSKATQSIQDRIAGIVKRDFPQYTVQRITPESLKQQPRVLIGTFTPVNAQ